MNVEEKIRDCEYNLKQIKYFNPDPYYVNYFFKDYLKSVIGVYDAIFGEANRDFGLSISGKCTKEKFVSKVRDRNDHLALKFFSWFEIHYKNEHDNSYPHFIKKVLDFFVEYEDIPKITIKILSNQRYKDDIVQEIQVDLTKGKIRSKETLQIEINRQATTFLEIVNKKRKSNDEPQVSKNQVISSAFLELENYDVEISYACEIYLSVLIRFLEESRKEIKKLITWAD